MKAALKWVLQNQNVTTAIPGFTAFDQMELDLTVMENLGLTPEEKKDLGMEEDKTRSGLYCQQCGICEQQCSSNLDVPSLMRSYMYAYGYRNWDLARSTIEDLESSLPCSGCISCTVICPNGFDVRQKAADIIRLKMIPREFLG